MTTDRIRPKKSLGQNFLKDPHYLRRIADCAAIGPDDQVLEIGPGMGHLTRELAARAATVLCLELDDRLVPVLRAEFADTPNVRIEHADALLFDYASLLGTWKVVANLPYYISTPILQRLIADRSRFSLLVLMLQREVAERVASPPGTKEYGYLSVLVQLYTEPRVAFMVPPGAFSPPPKVESAVVRLDVREGCAVTVRDELLLIQVAKAAFAQRRKTLANALRPLDLSRQQIEEALGSAGIDPMRRGETLSLQEFARLADTIQAHLADIPNE